MANNGIKSGDAVKINNPRFVTAHGKTGTVVRTWNDGSRAEIKGGSAGWIKSIACSELTKI